MNTLLNYWHVSLFSLFFCITLSSYFSGAKLTTSLFSGCGFTCLLYSRAMNDQKDGTRILVDCLSWLTTEPWMYSRSTPYLADTNQCGLHVGDGDDVPNSQKSVGATPPQIIYLYTFPTVGSIFCSKRIRNYLVTGFSPDPLVNSSHPLTGFTEDGRSKFLKVVVVCL